MKDKFIRDFKFANGQKPTVNTTRDQPPGILNAGNKYHVAHTRI
jgi:hypothetical protein